MVVSSRQRQSGLFDEFAASSPRVSVSPPAANSPRNVMQITLRHGLRRKPCENPASIDDLMDIFERQGGLCAVSGLKMTWAQGSVLPTSLSLDRIDSNESYTKDNIRLVCHAVNAFKGRMNDEEMLTMARAIVAKADAVPSMPSWWTGTDSRVFSLQ